MRGGRLGRQGETKPFQQESLVPVGFGVATQDQGAAIGGREVDIEHLDPGELASTAREVRPGANGLSCARKVMCRQ
jgi:hypothetical protein